MRRNLDLQGFFDETYLFNSADEVISFLDQTLIKIFSCPSYWISENQEMHNTAMYELSTTSPLGVVVGGWVQVHYKNLIKE